MDAPASSAAPPPPSESPAEAPRRRSGGQKRKSATSSSTAPAKRLMKERNALNIHSSSPLHNGPVTRARQSPSKLVAAANHPEASATAAEEAASCPAAVGGRTDDGAAAGAETEEMAVAADEPVVDPEFDAVRSRGSDVHVVPVPAGWFSWKDIHPIEKHMLASFFNGKLESRTPDIYLEIRNSIMKKFHTDPQTQFELKDLSDISIGDAEARQEVMEFLAHWGLINFHPFPPSNLELNNLDNGVEQPSSLVEKLYKFEMVQSCPWIRAKKVEVSVPAEMPKSLPKSTVPEDLVGPVGPSVEYHCNSCSADCSRTRYHCPKEADFDLCTECYNNGKFGSGMTPADFILMEPAEVPGVSGGSWTDQETLLLLEALELFGENWNEIAEHVATKSKAHCILHFLQMSIEDPFLDGNDDAGEEVQEEMEPNPASKESNASGVHETKEADNTDGADKPYSSTTADVRMKRDATEIDVSCENGSSLPIDALKAAFQAIGLTPEQGLPSFAEVGNPVMAVAAFLTHLVEPYAATTSTRSSLKAMSEESPGIQLATRHCFILEKPPNDMKDPLASASAITDMDIVEAPKEEDQMPTSNESDELNAPNGTDEPKPSNVSDELKPLNVSDEIKPTNGSDGTKPSNNSNELQPSKGRDELQPSKGNAELQSSKGSDELKPSDGDVDSKTLNGDDQSKPSNGSDDSNCCPNKNEEGAVPIENETQLPLASQDCLKKTPATKESGDAYSPLQAAPTSTKEPNDISEGEQISPSAVKDTREFSSPTILSTNSKESGDVPFQGEIALNTANETNVSETAGVEKTDSAREMNKVASVDEIEPNSGTSMIVDTKLTSAPSEEPEAQQKIGTDSALDNKERADGDEKDVSPCITEKSQTPTETNNADHKINKLKRAAATVLSSAAVKAKLLANQEEDQIRQLVSLIIEKQLLKLDAKLALFTEIGSVIMRVREQTEKARQRLVHERAQIIAARFGLPVPPSRANLTSSPGGKLAAGYATTGSKPLTMASQKTQPMRRP